MSFKLTQDEEHGCRIDATVSAGGGEVGSASGDFCFLAILVMSEDRLVDKTGFGGLFLGYRNR